MNDLRQAAEMALKVLEEINEISKPPVGIPLPAEIDGAMEALRQALAQPVDAINMSQERVDKTAKGVLQELNAFMHPPVVSSAIRAGRAVLGWSQQQLAARAELSVPTISRLESRLANSTIQTIEQMLSAFSKEGVSIKWGIPGKNYVISVKKKNT